jgi:hypothetical protein
VGGKVKFQNQSRQSTELISLDNLLFVLNGLTLRYLILENKKTKMTIKR